jgi:hypothetical protein
MMRLNIGSPYLFEHHMNILLFLFDIIRTASFPHERLLTDDLRLARFESLGSIVIRWLSCCTPNLERLAGLTLGFTV